MIAQRGSFSLACSAMNRRIVALTAAAIVVAACPPLHPAWAEAVEVAPGIEVTRKAFAAPASEAPFFGLVDKDPTLRKTDDVFISLAVEVYGSRANVFEALSRRGWEAIAANDLEMAGTRFNQAWLFSPGQSQIFHGFAMIALARFHDSGIRRGTVSDRAQGAGRIGNAECGLRPHAAGREPAARCRTDIGAGGEGYADIGHCVGGSRRSAPAKRQSAWCLPGRRSGGDVSGHRQGECRHQADLARGPLQGALRPDRPESRPVSPLTA